MLSLNGPEKDPQGSPDRAQGVWECGEGWSFCSISPTLSKECPWLDVATDLGLCLWLKPSPFTAALGAAVGHGIGLALPATCCPAGRGDREGLERGLPTLLSQGEHGGPGQETPTGPKPKIAIYSFHDQINTSSQVGCHKSI